MEPFAGVPLVIVAFEFEGGCHLCIAEEPVSELVIEVVGATLDKCADGFGFGESDEERIVVSAFDF